MPKKVPPRARSEAVLNIPDVPAAPILENIACLLPPMPKVDGSNLIAPVLVLGYINHCGERPFHPLDRTGRVFPPEAQT
jgi:hypothetical protein